MHDQRCDLGARQAGAKRRCAGPGLMAGENPADHQMGALRSEKREIGKRQQQQRQPAQAVIPEQQIAVVVAVGQPARDDGAEEIGYDGAQRQCGRAGVKVKAALCPTAVAVPFPAARNSDT